MTAQRAGHDREHSAYDLTESTEGSKRHKVEITAFSPTSLSLQPLTDRSFVLHY